MATQRNTNRTGNAKQARRGRALASENPVASKTVGNGKGNGKSPTDVPELTPQQRLELDAVKGRKSGAASPNKARGRATQYNSRREDPAPTPLIGQLLTERLKGVGKATAEQAVKEAGLAMNAAATRVMLNRANAAPKEKAGLRGKALAMWVLTGDSNGGKRSEPAQAAPPARRERADIPQSMLIEYLNTQVSGDEMAPAEFKPTVDENGKLRIKSAHWREWLASKSTQVGNAAAVKVLREAGLEQERWFTLPRGQRMCYVGAVPKGTKKLPVRKDTPMPGITQTTRSRAASGQRPFARPSVEQIDVLTGALKAFKPKGPAKAANEQVRDELLALLQS